MPLTKPMHRWFAHGSYLHALRLLLAPQRLRESLHTDHPPSLRNSAVAGTQVAIAAFVVAAALHFSPWSHVLGFASMGALAALFGRAASVPQRRRIVPLAGLLLVGPVTLLSWLSWHGLEPWALLLALSILSGLLASIAHRLQLRAPGAVIFIFAASTALQPLDSLTLLWQRSAAMALGVAAAVLLCRLTDHLRVVATTPQPAMLPSQKPSPTPSPGYAARQSLRVAFCAAVSAGIAHAAGWSHPAWAAIGAVAVLQGAHLPGTVHRAWQRTLGTVVGAAIAWALLTASPSLWTLLLAVAVLQISTEMSMGVNYALGQVFVTPMALLMTALAMPGEATDMAISRIFDTALGAGVGTVLAWAFSTLDERVYLARHHRQQKKSPLLPSNTEARKKNFL